MSISETELLAKADVPEMAEMSGVPVGFTDKDFEIIDLYSGKEINESRAVRLALERPVHLIVTGGPVDYGKTTLLTSLYELFQEGPVAGQRFAGSMTLPAFEEKCHYARLASHNLYPNTPRTQYKTEAEYLHLRTSSVDVPANNTDFVLTDVSGEMFQRATNSESECKQLTFVKRASQFLLLFDTGKALQTSRWDMLRSAKMLLRSFLDLNMLSPYCVVTVVWSKNDFYVAGTDKEKEALDMFRAEVTKQFEKDFKHRVVALRFTEIAAQPLKQPDLRYGNGVSKLFSQWISDSEGLRCSELHPIGIKGTRESELFAQRYQPEEMIP